MDWALIIRIGHVVGTVLGVGGATFAEIFYLKSMRDGKIDEVEGGFLKTTYTVLRLGIIILVISGFSFLLLDRFEGREDRLYSVRLWTKMALTLLIVVNAVLLQTRRIPFWLGSALSLAAWYTALVLGLWRGFHYNYPETAVGFVILVVLVAVVQKAVRKKLVGAGT